MPDFLDHIKRRAHLIGGPSNGRDIPMPLPESMPWPEFTCAGAAGPKPRTWLHYVHTGGGMYRYAGPCAGIDHQGAPPHDHCEHLWDDESGPGHRCELLYGHDDEHICGCCHAQVAS